jgi:hypothetical protein
MVAKERFEAVNANWSNNFEEIRVLIKGRSCGWIVKDGIGDHG